MEFNQIIELIKVISDSDVNNFKMSEGELKINISKDLYTKQMVSDIHGVEGAVTAPVVAPVTPVVAQETIVASQSEPQYEGNVVKCPLVGTFYAAPSPDQPPFVSVGDKVTKGQVLGIVEAMKLMNDIESEFDGTVEAILVNNEEVVEYGQPMFVIK